ALRPGLAPFASLIIDILTQIQRLLSDSDKLKAKYGLASSMDGTAGIRATMPGNFALVDNVKELLRAAERGRKMGVVVPSGHSSWRKGFHRLSWALASKTHFERLIAELRRSTDSLNQLLRESQLTVLSQQWHSIGINAVARANDPRVLKALQEATADDENCQEIFSMAKRKTILISDDGGWTSNSNPGNYKLLSKKDFELPSNFTSLSRCIAKYRRKGSSVLIERRNYQAHNQSELFFRLHQLIKLVNASPSQNLLCEGYWSEPRGDCWYLVYRFPRQTIAPSPKKPSEPLSLRHLISTRMTYRPPLEARLKLACALAASFSRFYGSKWLHKAVRSENIVFPRIDSIVGFTEFSRPLNPVPKTLPNPLPNPLPYGLQPSYQIVAVPPLPSYQPLSDPSFNLPAAYRMRYHPQYLKTNTPYSMAFDIYSFGLVLVEIGRWLPLESFQTSESRSEESFMRKIMKWQEKELAYMMGTPYKDVVQWCLTRNAGSEADLAVEFYTKVVIPLSNISRWEGR
ncbi:hypothetical protein C8J57DRAFT_1291366, partial [Mycena rebaudengoi]